MQLDSHLFRLIVERIKEPVFVRDPDRNVCFVNPACERLMGLTAGEMIGRRCHELFGWVDDLCRPDEPLEHELIDAGNTRHWVRVTVSPFEIGGTSAGTLAIIEDLTALRKVQDALEKASADFRGQLEERTAALSRINELLNWENQERQRVEESLVEARDQAERASNAKSEFLSCMSHELRTPMNAILGFAQLLESEHDEPLTANQQECVTEILDAGRHLLELIEQVLDLTRIDSGRLQLRLEDLSIVAILDEIESLIGPVAAAKRINVRRTAFPGERVLVRGDAERVKQILSQLISNAVEFNRPEGSVELGIEIKPNHRVRITVRDTGPGIAPEHQRLVFEPFVKSLKEDFIGSGIGLVIAKRLAELMSGEIGFESRLGEGSLFWVELPHVETLPVAESPAAPVDALQSVPRKSILCVEDNPANLNLIKHLLRRLGNVELLAATNGYLAIELARAHTPDLILMDIQLPGLNGYEALQRLRSFPETASIPVVAVTVMGASIDLESGREAGFDEYLTKPIDVKRFREVVARILELPTKDESERST